MVAVKFNGCLYGMENPDECPWDLEECITVEARKYFLKRIFGCPEEMHRSMHGAI